jgi:hypothetical protein
MTDAHKKALAAGREQWRAVRDYLERLEYSKPTRGRKRDASPERLDKLEAEIAETTSPVKRLELIQLRKDLEAAADVADDPREAEAIRKRFIRHARSYARAKGISYGAFREVGVPADVLREAGITRGSS